MNTLRLLLPLAAALAFSPPALFAQAPEAGQKLLVVCWTAPSVAGIDGAAETTLPAEDAELLVIGAAGYAALERSRSAVDSVNVSGYTPLQWAEWAKGRLEQFHGRLKELARQRGMGFAGPAAFPLEG